MKIYVNSNYEIKAINKTDNTNLIEYEIDKIQVFGNMSNFMILNYCYKPFEDGFSIYPSRDYSMLEILDIQENKINNLQVQNKELENALIELASLL